MFLGGYKLINLENEDTANKGKNFK